MKIVTFYSYKGGVGRTAALMNTAAILASHGLRTVCLDMDLEAPSLHTYVSEAFGPEQSLLYLLIRPLTPLRTGEHGPVKLVRLDGSDVRFLFTSDDQDDLHEYRKAVRTTPEDLRKRLREILNWLRETHGMQVALIDVRTGSSEIPSVAMSLSDLVVCVLRPDATHLRYFVERLKTAGEESGRPTVYVVVGAPDTAKSNVRLKDFLHGADLKDALTVPFSEAIFWDARDFQPGLFGNIASTIQKILDIAPPGPRV